MTEPGWLAEQFERNRPHMQAVAYSMLGSVSEAQDAVQEAWLRLGRSDTGAIDDLLPVLTWPGSCTRPWNPPPSRCG